MSFPWIYVSDIARHEGQEVLLKGWLYGKRSSGKLQVLQIRVGTGTVQGVLFKGDVPEELFNARSTSCPRKRRSSCRGS